MGDLSGWKSIPVQFQPQQSGICSLWFVCAGPAGHEHANSVFLELRHPTAVNAGIVCRGHLRWYPHHSYMESARTQSGTELRSSGLPEQRSHQSEFGCRQLLAGPAADFQCDGGGRNPEFRKQDDALNWIGMVAVDNI